MRDGLLCDGCTRAARDAVASLRRLLPELVVSAAGEDETVRAVMHGQERAPVPDVAVLEVAEARAVPARLRSLDGQVALRSFPIPGNLTMLDLDRRVRAWLDVELGGLRARAGGWAAARGRLAGPVCPAHVHDYRPGGCGHTRCARLHCRHDTCTRIRGGVETVDVDLEWLAAHLHTLRADLQAGRILTGLRRWVDRLEEAVDRRDPGVYAGPCDRPDVRVELTGDGTLIPVPGICGVDLYCDLEDQQVACQACGAVYDVAERREWLLDTVRHVWARPGVITSALAGLGEDLTSVRLDQWISRDRREVTAGRAVQGEDGRWRRRRDGLPLVVQVATDFDDEDGRPILDSDGRQIGRPLYLVGDVLDRLAAYRASRPNTRRA